MTRVANVTAKAPWLLFWPRRESRAAAPSKQRSPAEQAPALRHSESHYQRVKDTTEASFLMNGGPLLIAVSS